MVILIFSFENKLNSQIIAIRVDVISRWNLFNKLMKCLNFFSPFRLHGKREVG